MDSGEHPQLDIELGILHEFPIVKTICICGGDGGS